MAESRISRLGSCGLLMLGGLSNAASSWPAVTKARTGKDFLHLDAYRLPSPPFFSLPLVADPRSLQDLCDLLASVCLSNAMREDKYGRIEIFLLLSGAFTMGSRRLHMHC